jgi:hypothetical protein
MWKRGQVFFSQACLTVVLLTLLPRHSQASVCLPDPTIDHSSFAQYLSSLADALLIAKTARDSRISGPLVRQLVALQNRKDAFECAAKTVAPFADAGIESAGDFRHAFDGLASAVDLQRGILPRMMSGELDSSERAKAAADLVHIFTLTWNEITLAAIKRQWRCSIAQQASVTISNSPSPNAI